MEELKSNAGPCRAPALSKRACKLLFVLFVPALLIGTSIHLLSSQHSHQKAKSASEAGFLKEGECDLFSGQWVHDESALLYTNETCKYIVTDFQNCLKNGRPDTEYLYWKWKPHNCNFPEPNAAKFLNSMKNKSLALIGDSLLRNQMESLLCLASKAEEAILVEHDEWNKSRTWHFPIHNVTLGQIWAPYLVKSEGIGSKDDVQIWLDTLDETWTSQYSKYDYIVLTGGHWFLRENVLWDNGKIIGCSRCPGKNLPELGMDYSYRKALELAFRFMVASDHKPELVFLRTWTPNHFEYGDWDKGGLCNRTQPCTEGQCPANPLGPEMHLLEIEEFEKGLKNGLPLRLLDIHYMSTLRPDGHPGPYRKLHPDISKKPQNDCVHWCMPGPIDAWNELLMYILQNEVYLNSM